MKLSHFLASGRHTGHQEGSGRKNGAIPLTHASPRARAFYQKMQSNPKSKMKIISPVSDHFTHKKLEKEMDRTLFSEVFDDEGHQGHLIIACARNADSGAGMKSETWSSRSVHQVIVITRQVG